MAADARRSWLLLSLPLLFLTSVAHAAASFVVFNGAAGSPAGQMIYAYNISHGGEIVVGETTAEGGVHGPGAYAKRTGTTWTLHKIPTLPSAEPPYSSAYDVAANNGMIVGFANSGTPAVDLPYHYLAPGPLVPMGLFPGDKVGEARGINTNGSFIVGWGLSERSSRYDAGAPFRHALRWSVAAPNPILIDTSPNPPQETVAMAVTNTGNAIAGFGTSPISMNTPFNPTDSRGHQAIVWLRIPGPGTKYQRFMLPFLSTTKSCARAYDIDEEGQRLAGFSGVFSASRPVLWIRQHPSGFSIRDLGTLPGYDAGGANGISPDGEYVVGSCYQQSGDEFHSTAFIWDRRNGMREIRKLLIDAHVPGIEDWTLSDATAVSRNGRWVCGNATNSTGDVFAYVASMP